VSHAWAVLLGLVQGVTEFLPISSTAHLRLIPWVFGVDTSLPLVASAQFDIALHAGSFIAILAALWSDWVGLFSTAFGPRAVTVSEKCPTQDPLVSDRTQARRFIGFLLVTSVPAGIVGVLLDQPLEKYSTPAEFHAAPLLVGTCLALFGVLLWAVDRYVARQDPIGSMTWWKAFGIGCAQAVALIPGVSRSGSTMTAGRAMGFSRETTARYSFMAALPIIGGAAAWGLRDVPISTLLSLDWVLGFAAAALSSYLFMRVMLAYVRKHTFSVFMWYRIAAGLFFIALFLIRG
jgi:undecaprenyl-diphosphatase